MRLLRGFVFRLTFPLWTLYASFALLIWPLVEGQARMIGSSRPVRAVLGEDVILPCHLEPEFNVKALTVEWSRPDQNPDLSDQVGGGAYVHIHWNRPVRPDTMPEYDGRTTLFKDALTRGNISLKILNVTMEDQGTYKCFVPRLRSEAMVELLIDANYATTEATLIPVTPERNDWNDTTVSTAGSRLHYAVLISAALFCITLFACALKCKFQEQKDAGESEASVKQLV